MKTFLSITAILAWFIGVMLLFMPEQFYSPTGISLTPLLATIAQAHGATLVGLGVINWFARNAERKGLMAVMTGNLAVQILSLFVAIKTMTLGAGSGAAPAIVIHIVLGIFYTFFLLKLFKTKTEV